MEILCVLRDFPGSGYEFCVAIIRTLLGLGDKWRVTTSMNAQPLIYIWGGNHQVHSHQRLGVGGVSEWVSEISSLVLKLLFHEALEITSFIHEEKTRK